MKLITTSYLGNIMGVSGFLIFVGLALTGHVSTGLVVTTALFGVAWCIMAGVWEHEAKRRR